VKKFQRGIKGKKQLTGVRFGRGKDSFEKGKKKKPPPTKKKITDLSVGREGDVDGVGPVIQERKKIVDRG